MLSDNFTVNVSPSLVPSGVVKDRPHVSCSPSPASKVPGVVVFSVRILTLGLIILLLISFDSSAVCASGSISSEIPRASFSSAATSRSPAFSVATSLFSTSFSSLFSFALTVSSFSSTAFAAFSASSSSAFLSPVASFLSSTTRGAPSLFVISSEFATASVFFSSAFSSFSTATLVVASFLSSNSVFFSATSLSTETLAASELSFTSAFWGSSTDSDWEVGATLAPSTACAFTTVGDIKTK